MHLLLRFIFNALALYLTVQLGIALGLHLYIDPGVHGAIAALIAALVLGIVNAIIRPILVLITLPITCLTLGLFSLVINAICFWLVGQLVPGFHVRGLLAALFGTIVMSLVSGLLNLFLISGDERNRAVKHA
jgi:putative membrane protein